MFSFMSERAGRLSVEHASALAAELRATLTVLKRKLREHGGQSDLTPSQVSVILRLEKDGAATVSSLARVEGMRPQSMSAIVNSLLDAGLVDGSADPNDARKTLMSLSRECLKSLRQGRAAKQDWLTSTIQQKFSAQDQAKVEAVLEVLARLVGD
jgi:DNA-binding MarR family transcriptional regulator